MKEKLGILIPMYNSERYIKRCLDSIIGQTYKNLEVIIINDGSTDKSLEICRQIINDDERFKVYTRENKGVAFTRNELIQKCNSKYIVFIDSDDFIDEDYIEVLYKIITKYNADMVASKIYLYDENKKKLNKDANTKVINNIEGLKRLLYNHEIQHGPVCKMYKKELFENIEFPNKKVYEDLAIMYKIVDRCSKIALTNYQGYNYTYNIGGITKSSFSDSEISMLEYGEEIFEYITKKYGKELLLPAKNIIAEQSVELACKIPIKKQYEAEIKRIKQYIKSYRVDLLKSKDTYPRIKAYLLASFFGIRGIKIAQKILDNNKKYK